MNKPGLNVMNGWIQNDELIVGALRKSTKLRLSLGLHFFFLVSPRPYQYSQPLNHYKQVFKCPEANHVLQAQSAETSNQFLMTRHHLTVRSVLLVSVTQTFMKVFLTL